MADIKAIYDYERKPVVPRVKPMVPQLVRQDRERIVRAANRLRKRMSQSPIDDEQEVSE